LEGIEGSQLPAGKFKAFEGEGKKREKKFLRNLGKERV